MSRQSHADQVYDALLLPALNYAERDRLERRLSVEEETAVIDATRELLTDAADSIRRQQPSPKSRQRRLRCVFRANRYGCSAMPPMAPPTSSR